MNRQSRAAEAGTFARYVSLNILGMVGVSCYILADTFFISRASGADGITVLNLCLPVYSLIYALGELIGTGASIAEAIDLSGQRRERYFGQALLWTALIGGAITLVGVPGAGAVLRRMGGDAEIAALGTPYLRTVFAFTVFFMANYTFLGFVRNDGAPGLGMAATITSSLFNVLFDYLLMFPLGMGMTGAALATGLSPIVSILICSTHLLRRDNHLRCSPGGGPDPRLLLRSCRMGTSGFIGQFSGSVTTAVFNFLLLELAGNAGVAAYGIVANYAIIATALMNGLAQGTQPLVSRSYARGEWAQVNRTWIRGIVTALAMAGLLYLAVWGSTRLLSDLFNSEGSPVLRALSMQGLRIYFTGYFFCGLNVFIASSLNAQSRALPAMILSLCRGVLLIVLCALVLSQLFGIIGIWAAFPAAEGLTFVLAVGLSRRESGRRERNSETERNPAE